MNTYLVEVLTPHPDIIDNKADACITKIVDKQILCVVLKNDLQMSYICLIAKANYK